MDPVTFQRLRPAELISPLSRAECIERLRKTVLSPWSISPAPGIVGRVKSDSVTLRCRIWYRNSFQTILRGRLEDDPDGTRIAYCFGMNRFVFVFMCAWFGGVILIGGTMFVASFIEMLNGGDWGKLPHWLGMAVPLAMIAFGIGLLKFGWYLARNERGQMIEFLKRTLDARELT